MTKQELLDFASSVGVFVPPDVEAARFKTRIVNWIKVQAQMVIKEEAD